MIYGDITDDKKYETMQMQPPTIRDSFEKKTMPFPVLLLQIICILILFTNHYFNYYSLKSRFYN